MEYNRQLWGQQDDGSFVFPIRISGLPAWPGTPAEMARTIVAQLIEPAVWHRYGPLCHVSVVEPAEVTQV